MDSRQMTNRGDNKMNSKIRVSHARDSRWARHTALALVGMITLALSLGATQPAIGSGETEVVGNVSAASRGFPSVVILEAASPARVQISSEPARINQIDKSFTPGVVVARVGQVVEFHNGESLLHNVHMINLDSGDTLFNIAMPVVGMVHRFTPEEPGVYAVLCDVHPEMEAYVIATNSPYFTVAAEDGSFEMPEVPTGSYTMRVWNVRESRSFEREVQVTGPTTVISSGR